MPIGVMAFTGLTVLFASAVYWVARRLSPESRRTVNVRLLLRREFREIAASKAATTDVQIKKYAEKLKELEHRHTKVLIEESAIKQAELETLGKLAEWHSRHAGESLAGKPKEA